MSRIPYVVAILLAFSAPSFHSHAQLKKPLGLSAAQPAASAPIARGTTASPRERGDLARQFVRKWGNYVQRVYGIQAIAWAKRIGPTFGIADADNLRNALSRDSFEGAMAELNGIGTKLTDRQARAKLIALGGEKTLGALANDLVYTPVQPCRIVDTRSTVAGAIAAGGTRSFTAVNAPDYISQGGSATNCGTVGVSATAVAINFTAVPISGGGAAGHATVYPYNTAQPNTASVNYSGTQAENNTLVAQIPNPVASFDFTVFSTSQSHFVADIVGYYAPPVATALQCTSVDGVLRTLAAGEYALLSTVNCPAGYSAVSTSITASQDVVMADSYISASSVQIFAKNVSTLSQQAIPKATCCRVPGR